jgi:outer membrane protein TolC
MLSVSIPVFRGKHNAAREEARIMQRKYRLQREEHRNGLLTEFEMTHFEMGRQRQLIALYDEQIRKSRQSLNLLFSAYANSGRDFEGVLRMEQQLLKYRKLKATALTEFRIAREKLKYLTATEGTYDDF